MLDFDYHEKGRLLLHNREKRKVPTSLKESMIIGSGACHSLIDKSRSSVKEEVRRGGEGQTAKQGCELR